MNVSLTPARVNHTHTVIYDTWHIGMASATKIQMQILVVSSYVYLKELYEKISTNSTRKILILLCEWCLLGLKVNPNVSQVTN